MNKLIELFINDFLKEIEENNAAVFAGAGLSAASGFVDWKALLKEFADELDLDIGKETDLISLAQYHLNKNANNRHSLSQKIANEFHHGKKPNENHEILARLPISTYWTTNYDKLIEKSLENVNKVVDAKYTTAHLARTINGRDVTLYKMHGDVDHPDEAIISKDQYEKYYQSHGAYINTLSGDLTSKTFLFIGFSFTDPNLDYILSRVRTTFKDNQRKHYCFFREVKQEKDESDADYQYRVIKQSLVITDLLRFNIHVTLVKEYPEITDILREIERRFKRKTVYISGSAHEYGNWDIPKAESFISELSKALIRSDFKIVSGFGLGVGSSVINGVLEEVYIKRKENIKNQLLLRPFPQGDQGKLLWEKYRVDMISYAGISIFIFGNKLEDNKVVLANGIQQEFDISIKQNTIVLPIGATGYMAKKLWELVLNDFEAYFGSSEHIDVFKQLGDENNTPEQLIDLTLSLLNKLIKKR
ncbi:SIR2 family protein [Mucilaginibacter flavidus]|uniref:SIR2 family protein n=1 Tax=Mucilaginibacter flavidus TaxID=2949309 RepID=UPI002092AC2D|nr:SIR2 family protein [Mucilaginibacter flavidus]MCO5950873.1 SIR2 family protein [Mucilaginibacter flavidus]